CYGHVWALSSRVLTVDLDRALTPARTIKGQNMQTRMKERVIAALMTIGLVGLTAGCASIKGDDEKEGTRTSLAQLSEPARATVQRVTAGGQIEKIDRE